MTADLKGYQTKETEWRFHLRRGTLLRLVEIAERELAVVRADLDELEAHPPMYHLFNWSA